MNQRRRRLHLVAISLRFRRPPWTPKCSYDLRPPRGDGIGINVLRSRLSRPTSQDQHKRPAIEVFTDRLRAFLWDLNQRPGTSIFHRAR
jgi:hypothetical protein